MQHHTRRLPWLTDRIGYLWEKAREPGLADRLLVRVSTDFGRMPWINGSAGKDHWGIGTEILIEVSPAWGDRTYGVSGPHHDEVKIDPATGAVDPQNGVLIRTRHVHQAIRDYLRIDSVSPVWDFKIPANERLSGLFDPAAHSGYPNL